MILITCTFLEGQHVKTRVPRRSTNTTSLLHPWRLAQSNTMMCQLCVSLHVKIVSLMSFDDTFEIPFSSRLSECYFFNCLFVDWIVGLWFVLKLQVVTGILFSWRDVIYLKKRVCLCVRKTCCFCSMWRMSLFLDMIVI